MKVRARGCIFRFFLFGSLASGLVLGLFVFLGSFVWVSPFDGVSRFGGFSPFISFSYAGESDFTHAANRASLDQLAALQTFVRVGMRDGRFCADGDGAGSAAMMQTLEGEMRVKLGQGKREEVFRALFADGRRVRECEQRCRCGIYLGWLERPEAGGDRAPPAELFSEVAAWKKVLAPKAAQITEASLRRCAEANRKWICDSKLWRAFVDETKAVMESGS
jgi:hypothetical protein